MTTSDSVDLFSGVLGLALGLLILVWSVLVLMIPFMISGMRRDLRRY